MPSIPVAKKIPKEIKLHDDLIIDNFDWLRDRSWPDVKDKDVISYLEQENEYTEKIMSGREHITEDIFQELKSRIQEDDKTVPVKRGNYYYYSFIKKGWDYWAHARTKASLKAKEEIYLDENMLAKGRDYLSSGHKISPNHKMIAIYCDYDGDERYDIVIKDIASGKVLDEAIKDVFARAVWNEDNEGFFYTPAGENWRSEKVMYHRLGTDATEDILIHHESDNTFRVGVGKTRDKKYIVITSSSSNSSEYYYMSTDDMKKHLIIGRKTDQLYGVSHLDGYFYITINDTGKNFRLVRVPVANIQRDRFEEIVPHSKDYYIEGVDTYKTHVVVSKKENGLEKIEIYPVTNNNIVTTEMSDIKFNQSAYTAGAIYTSFDSDKMRFVYSALNTPTSIKEYDFKTKKIKTLKVAKIPSGFDGKLYDVKRLHATSRDGKQIPISLLYKKSLFKADNSNPLYLYGYGSYGISIEPHFSRNIISLVDRGFVYAIAHVRGGDDLGFEWYESAKFLNKKRTFEDFIDVTEYLIDEKYTSAKQIAIAGGSAGGMLMGAVINEKPELYKLAIMHVPFVDVLNTMSDDTLPLTPGEFKEWGNPKEKKYYKYIKSYCPYYNIKPQEYPSIFITAGLSDPRVTYWEGAKWVAKMRDTKTDNNLLLFKVNMEAGHQGKSGRFEGLKETALEFNFVLKQFSIEG